MVNGPFEKCKYLDKHILKSVRAKHNYRKINKKAKGKPCERDLPSCWQMPPGTIILIMNRSKDILQKKRLEDFKSLLLLSLALYQYYHLSFAWLNQLKKTLSPEESDRMKELKHLLAHGNEVRLGNRRLDPFRLKQMFNNYFEKDAEKSRQLPHEGVFRYCSSMSFICSRSKDLIGRFL